MQILVEPTKNMYYPTTRVLTVLELLQSQRAITGAEIARRLEIDVRTARRYIVMLGELGIPVVAERGRYGGYRLMPGFKLPPLMLTEDEALALTLGLLSARHLGLATHAPAVEGALAKIERVLPDQVRNRVRAVEETVVWDLGERMRDTPDNGIVLTLSTAAREQQRVSLCYRSREGAETRREFDPYGLACQRGQWYATGHCHLRNGLRLFRLDRISEVAPGTERFQRPDGFNVLEAVLKSLGSVPRAASFEVRLDTTLEHARWQVSARTATLEECATGGVLLRGYTDNLKWIAFLLAGLVCPFKVISPPELKEAVRQHAAQITEWVNQTD